MSISFKHAFVMAAILASPLKTLAQPNIDPVITFTFPADINLGGGERQKTVSGALLEKVLDENGKITRLKLSCDFAEALDPNSQTFCNTSEKLPWKYKMMRHYGVSHKTCSKQFGQLETNARRIAGDTNIEQDVNRLVGAGWESSPYCPVIDARDQLMAEYSKLGLTAE